jgi:alkylhydroperoxidase/carboxymuconolactone decarboxylase family protein YurZ
VTTVPRRDAAGGAADPSAGQAVTPQASCERLRVLATGEVARIVDPADRPRVRGLDERSRALLRLAALLTTGGGPATYDRHVAAALAAGANPDDLVELLVEVAPTLGLARLVPAAVELAAALGYDIDEAFERPSDREVPAGG